jgi:hypothetical protein
MGGSGEFTCLQGNFQTHWRTCAIDLKVEAVSRSILFIYVQDGARYGCGFTAFGVTL